MKWLSNFQKGIKELIVENQFLLYLFVFLVAFFVYLWIQSMPSFLDPDSFYHLKMSKLIAERGIIIDFPWLQFTVLKEYYVDHHFLYHIFAIPFINIFGDFAGFKLYTVILATIFIVLSYAFFKKYKIKYAELFALILLSSAAFLYRISLAKATAFSLIILFLGIYCVFRKKYIWLFLLSFFYVWSYGGFLLILVMAILYCLSVVIYNTFIERPLWLKLNKLKIFNYFICFIKNLFAKENIKILGITIIGIFLGIVLNPYFPKNLYFDWQQLVQIGLINYRGIVNVGGEWYPYKISELFTDGGVAIIFSIVVLILFFIFYKKQKTESIFFFLTTLLFLLLTLKSKRYVEYFIPFLVYFSAFSLSFILEKVNLKEFLNNLKKDSWFLGKLASFVLIYLIIVSFCIMAKDLYYTRQSFKGGFKLDFLKGPAEYLKNNAQAGEIIMHTDWDDFPMLFYYNDKNYYIVGLDPTFMYKYNPELYNLFADITMAKKSDNLSQTIEKNFNARYFIVNRERVQLVKNLQNDGNFVKVYEDKDGDIYKIQK